MMEKRLNDEKEQRLIDINELIILIGNRDRKFLSSHLDNYDTTRLLVYGQFFFKFGRLYYIDDNTNKEINMESKFVINSGFSHGGTLWGLILDFSNFILTGYYSNAKHGYGGLYCPHWGYSEESMKEIRDFATKIKYISGDYNKDRELYLKMDKGENFILT